MTTDQHATPVSGLDPLVARFEGPLVRYAARITGDVERARDVVQETFLALHRECANGDGISAANGHCPAWLFTVCRRRALDVRRKEQRMLTMTPSEADIYQADTCLADEPVGQLEQRETAGQLLGLLAGLPDPQQEVVRLKFQNGLSYREISEVTGLSVSNVGYLLHVAIKRLRELMVD